MAVHTPGALRATNAAALKTHIQTNLLPVQSDGSKRLDIEGVLKLFTDEVVAAVAANAALTNAALRASVTASDGSNAFIVPAATAAARVIGRENWETRAGWPLSKDADGKDQRIAKVDSYQGETWTLAREIIFHAEARITDLPALIRAWIDDNMLSLNPVDSAGARVPGSYPAAEAARRDEIRFYGATYVTSWGEESRMSDPGPVQLPSETNPDAVAPYDPRDTLRVIIPAAPAGRDITAARLYRSSTTETGAAYQLVGEYSLTMTPAPTTYTITNENLAQEFLGEPCPTLTWQEPPADLDDLVGLPNGIMAGGSGAVDIRFCEPYHPYAWPPEYGIALEHPRVGMAVFGQTLFVGTKGNPYFISGADSMSMSANKLPSEQACVAARGIAVVEGGVLYPSPDGLCLASGAGRVDVVTEGVYSREAWQAIDPANRFAAFHEGVYYSFHANATGAIPPCLAIDLASKRVSTLTLTATAAWTDKTNDTLYVAVGTSVLGMFLGATNRTGVWKSGRLVLEQPDGFAWLQVLGQHSVGVPATVKVYWDNGSGQILLHTATVTGIEPVRLPPGRSGEWEIEVTCAARVTRVTLASTVEELNRA